MQISLEYQISPESLIHGTVEVVACQHRHGGVVVLSDAGSRKINGDKKSFIKFRKLQDLHFYFIF